MRAPIALAALALAGTALLGGPGQAFADDSDEMGKAGSDFGNNAPAKPNFGEGTSDSDPSVSSFDQHAPGSNQSAPGSGPVAPSFGAVGSVFDPTN
ncbi:hypothetical protein [Streptomyces sp. NPDC059010]|uniref:hypothetical protein n=1 Tax=Streptomyces sp. NPDC059010 TaxID=3346695 RepID=UPI0036B50B9F